MALGYTGLRMISKMMIHMYNLSPWHFHKFNLIWFENYRKGGLLFNNIVGILGAAAMGFAKFAESYELLIMGRFLIGVNCGE